MSVEVFMGLAPLFRLSKHYNRQSLFLLLFFVLL
jgi:hypothetical protein